MSIPFIYLILVILVALSWFLGKYMYWIMDAAEKWSKFRFGLEKFLDYAGGRYLKEDQNWKQYSISLMIFNIITFGISFLLLALQQYLPLNPDRKGALEYGLIFNTVASFTTNTNLQHYSGEVSMSYFSQLFTMMWHQFISAGTGVAALTAMARGLAGNQKLGNFYRDFARATFLIFLPLASVVATILALSGMVMTLEGSVVARTLEG
ncbi:MAG: potassium-transporting ATPase subunit KdpA, partial [Patescibacteria group bacterium]|nr:potassium-transporting ATPase subunit KdpA [Patescibacteria group bacterium]